jgi:oligopeptide/dipeptide ABC transporter ATP-binding protein
MAGIPGTVPNLLHPPQGCRFQTRCALAGPDCLQKPALRSVEDAHSVACHRQLAEVSHAA